jgi:hypothetical protein
MMAKRKKAKGKAVARRKTKPVSKATRTSTVSAAKKVRRAQIKIMNERWSEGGGSLKCDVNFEGRLISNVSVGTAEGFPPGGQVGEVLFPAGADLQEKDQGMIETAVLACYYGVEL